MALHMSCTRIWFLRLVCVQTGFLPVISQPGSQSLGSVFIVDDGYSFSSQIFHGPVSKKHCDAQ